MQNVSYFTVLPPQCIISEERSILSSVDMMCDRLMSHVEMSQRSFLRWKSSCMSTWTSQMYAPAPFYFVKDFLVPDLQERVWDSPR